jgi:hypothetical protein
MRITGSIKLSIVFEDQWWVGIFKRVDENGYAVAREIFGSEPTDAEVYQFVLHHQDKLKFSQPLDDNTPVIKKLNPKRLNREVRSQQNKGSNMTKAYDALRIEMEKNKKEKKTNNTAERERIKQLKFDLKQKKKKEKHQGH